MDAKPRRFYEFGPFRLDEAGRRLLLEGREVTQGEGGNGRVERLPPKAFDLLLFLVRHAGETLGRQEILDGVWADAHVEQGRVDDGVSTLRKFLGDRARDPTYIETVPRGGYRFAADVREVVEERISLAERTRASVVIEEESEPPPAPGSVAAISPAPLAHAPSPPRAGGRGGREGFLLVGVLLLIAAAAAALALRWTFKAPSTDEPRRATLPAVAGGGQQARAGDLKITRVTNSGIAWCASISPDGRFVVYGENYPYGAGTLYLKQLGTNHEVRLLEPAERACFATAFSSDGSFIYYTANEKNAPEPSLYRVHVLGGVPTPLFPNVWFFSLSPDGARVAFYREAPDRKDVSVVVAALDGSGERTLLTRRRDETVLQGGPAFSPDGSLIAFAAGVEREMGSAAGSFTVHAADSATGEVRQLSAERFNGVGKMVWMPDGTGLVFVGWRPGFDGQLYFLPYPTGEPRRITNDLVTYSHTGLGITADSSALVADAMEQSLGLWVVGADGEAAGATRLTLGHLDAQEGVTSLPGGRIAYVARTGETYDIWTVKEDGTEARPLTADPHLERDPAATPDGRYLVFTSDRAGSNQLFRVNADGTGLTQLTFGPARAYWPDCSPDGRWVVYASTSEGVTTLWKVPIEGGEPVRLTDYGAQAPVYSPDGRLLACVLPATGQRQSGVAVIPAEGGAPLKDFRRSRLQPDSPPGALGAGRAVARLREEGEADLQPLAAAPRGRPPAQADELQLGRDQQLHVLARRQPPHPLARQRHRQRGARRGLQMTRARTRKPDKGLSPGSKSCGEKMVEDSPSAPREGDTG